MNRYIISRLASSDLNAIADYFLERNLDAGERLFQEFNQTCQKLTMFPNMGKSYAHLKPGLRGLPFRWIYYFLSSC
ncbi:type II toxin-antitoxin system RelE/ParE family toxin [Okeania sp.]|uniref:type II toxin-antitoxin system RelE/ParE family toxin n=1 Tax=Okeania sp. TaxID=3100323 RepID=UPI002B4B4592|nr:type II toxin-antitoxin system RelE/ParE family toxin [Okeania sp.]MEB3339983.1 type II toxin-antitoxin system RelE/ParE family toxin [Okeania sp.]